MSFDGISRPASGDMDYGRGAARVFKAGRESHVSCVHVCFLICMCTQVFMCLFACMATSAASLQEAESRAFTCACFYA